MNDIADVMHFIKGLGSRYSGLKLLYSNRSRPWPTTLQAAYGEADQFKDMEPISASSKQQLSGQTAAQMARNFAFQAKAQDQTAAGAHKEYTPAQTARYQRKQTVMKIKARALAGQPEGTPFCARCGETGHGAHDCRTAHEVVDAFGEKITEMAGVAKPQSWSGKPADVKRNGGRTAKFTHDTKVMVMGMKPARMTRFEAEWSDDEDVLPEGEAYDDMISDNSYIGVIRDRGNDNAYSPPGHKQTTGRRSKQTTPAHDTAAAGYGSVRGAIRARAADSVAAGNVTAAAGNVTAAAVDSATANDSHECTYDSVDSNTDDDEWAYHTSQMGRGDPSYAVDRPSNRATAEANDDKHTSHVIMHDHQHTNTEHTATPSYQTRTIPVWAASLVLLAAMFLGVLMPPGGDATRTPRGGVSHAIASGIPGVKIQPWRHIAERLGGIAGIQGALDALQEGIDARTLSTMGKRGADESADGITSTTQSCTAHGFPTTQIRRDNASGVRDSHTVTYLNSIGVLAESVAQKHLRGPAPTQDTLDLDVVGDPVEAGGDGADPNGPAASQCPATRSQQPKLEGGDVESIPDAMPESWVWMMGGRVNDASEVHPAGVQGAEVPPAGVHSAGVHSSGVNSAGVHSAGVHSSGVNSAGVHSAGVHSAGVHSAGVSSAGVHSAGVHSAGVHSAGVHSAGVHSAGVHFTAYTGVHHTGVHEEQHSRGVQQSGVHDEQHNTGVPEEQPHWSGGSEQTAVTNLRRQVTARVMATQKGVNFPGGDLPGGEPALLRHFQKGVRRTSKWNYKTYATMFSVKAAMTIEKELQQMINKQNKELYDDIPITWQTKDTIVHVLAAIVERHPETTMSFGPKVAFLGMSVESTRREECEVIMNRMCDEIVDSCSVEGVATSLPMETLFEVDSNKIPLDNTAKQKCFHPYVAKFLHLAKRVETECLTTACHCMSLHVTACHCMSLHVTTRHCMSLHVTACHCMSLHVTACPCTSLHVTAHVTACHCTSLHVTACHCMPLHVTACHCMPLHVTACHCMSLHVTARHCTSLHVTACHCMSLHVTACHCMSTVSYLATRANKIDTDGIGKLDRLHWYLGYSGGRGVRLWHGERGVCVRVYIDGAYGVHVDGKSNTDSTQMVGDKDLYYAKSGKQSITVKPSTEAEFVETSDHMNQASHLHSFTIIQGHSDSPVETLQDNMSYMAALRKSRSTSLGKRHIQFRNSWISERIDRGEGYAIHMKTEMMGATIILTRILSRRQLPPEGQAPIVQDKGV
jgi:hypothetical protein